jgi:hypothetical protein
MGEPVSEENEVKLMHVSLACNDENGIFQGECAAVQVEDDDGEVIISFECIDVPMRWEVASMILDKEEFKVSGRTQWVGNLFWDGTRMTPQETERMVRWLIANAGRPFEWNKDHPVGRLAETEVRAS